MLTAHMNQTEVVAEVMQDVKWLHGQMHQQSPLINREFKAQMRTGQRTLSVVRERRSPQGNQWTMMMVWHRERATVPLAVFYTVLQNEDGPYVYAPTMSPEGGMMVLMYTPHFFRRYRERMELGDRLTTLQLIRRYMRDNCDGRLEPGPPHKGLPSWIDSTADGVGLGDFASSHLFVCNTFVTRQMAFPGRQSRDFRRGEQRLHESRAEADLRIVQRLLKPKGQCSSSVREVFRLCDEAVEDERQHDEMIRQRREQAAREAAANKEAAEEMTEETTTE